MNPTSEPTPLSKEAMDARYTPEEIDRELALYPRQAGVNKAGDIMRQLRSQLAELEQERREWNTIYRPMYGHDWNVRNKGTKGF